MNENEFQNYQLLEDAAILSLNGTWRVLREKLNKKISKIKETDSLDLDGLNTLEDALDTFEAQIRKAKSRTDEPKRKSATIARANKPIIKPVRPLKKSLKYLNTLSIIKINFG